MWHVPILDALGGPYLKQVLVGTPVCLAVAFVSYRLVEAPFLRLRGRWEGGPGRITAEPPPGWREESRPTEAAASPVAPAEHHAFVREHRAGGDGERPSRSVHRHAHLHDARAAGRPLRRYALDRADAARAHDHLLVGMGDRRRADDVGPQRVGLVAPAAARQPERGHRRGH